MNTIEIKNEDGTITISVVMSKIISFSKISPKLRDHRPRWLIDVGSNSYFSFAETWEIADQQYEALKLLLEHR